MSAAPSSVPDTVHASRTDVLHRAHSRSVFAYCNNRLRSREEAEDAVQVVFLNAQRSLERGVEPEFQRAWLLKIAERVVLNAQRASRRRARIEYPVDLDGIADVVAGTDRTVSTPLLEALARIPARQRRAFVLCEIHGLSHAEACDVLGVSEGAVAALRARGRRSLGAELSRSGERSGGLRGAKCLSALIDLKWLVGGFGAKLAAGGASLAVVALVSHHPGAFLGDSGAVSQRASRATVAVVQPAVPVRRDAVRLGADARRRRPLRTAVTHVSAISFLPVATAPGATVATEGDFPPPDVAPDVAPPSDEPGSDPAPRYPASNPNPDEPTPAAADPSSEPTDSPATASEEGADPKGLGRPSSTGFASFDRGPCSDSPCAAERAAHPGSAHGGAGDGAPQDVSNAPPRAEPSEREN
jgi:RNA polymerase sigma-70 factor (ECF subfamily)